MHFLRNPLLLGPWFLLSHQALANNVRAIGGGVAGGRAKVQMLEQLGLYAGGGLALVGLLLLIFGRRTEVPLAAPIALLVTGLLLTLPGLL